MHFAGIKLNPQHEALLLQLENEVGQVEYGLGSQSESGFAGVSKAADNAYVICITDQLQGEPLACSLAHQLLYALQIKAGFPLVEAADAKLPWQNVLSASINRLVLDLKATDEAMTLGFDHSFFFNQRYKEIKVFASTRATGQPLDSFQSLWFAIDLALALIFLSADKINFLLSMLKGREDEAVNVALQIINIIEKTGYATPGRAFLAMAEISTLLNSWSHCPIHYGDKVISSAQQYQTEFSNLRSLILG
ncbi:MAG: hypothetical protein ACOX0F_11085 [Syntrophomonadaceae bacterium]